VNEDDADDIGYLYESGPYCQHWADPWSCDHPCKRCGVTCAQHGGGDPPEGTCEDFEEP
jgi:hypothetical protein